MNKLDAMLLERSWRGVIARILCAGVLMLGVVWLPEIVTWEEATLFGRVFVPNEEKMRQLKWLGGAFVMLISVREAVKIVRLLRKGSSS